MVVTSRARLFLSLSVGLIFSMGVLMVFNTSAAEVLDRNLSASTYQALVRQLLYGLLGVAVAWGVILVGYDQIVRLATPILWLSVVSLAVVFLPGIGVLRNGAARWIGLGPFTLQPSEFAKIAVALYSVAVLGRYEKWNFLQLVKSGWPLLVPLALVILEPDNGTTVILGLTIAVCLFAYGIKLRYWLAPMGALAGAAVLFASQSTYVMHRIQIYLNPELDLLGRGHQPYQAKIAAGSGGFLGKGIGQSLQKLSYLPEAQNDYIAAIFAEEFGFLGVLTLVLLYGLLTAAGFTIAMRASTAEGRSLAIALTFLLTIQAFFNLGVVSGLVPTTGLNLPFFSQGGTSLMANIIAVALLLSIGQVRGKMHVG